jgi:hypothetical protein
MTTYDLRQKTNASSGQQIVHVNGTRAPFNPETAKPGQAASLDALNDLAQKVFDQDEKLNKILKLLENK